MLIHSLTPKNYASIVFKIQKKIMNIVNSGKELSIHFIPAHRNIEGNEMADLAAKAAHNNSSIMPNINPDDQVKSLKFVLLEMWEKRWNHEVFATGKGRHLRLVKTHLGNWPWAYHRTRVVETTLAKLRIGHANYNSHKYRFDLVPSPLCLCGLRKQFIIYF